MPGTPSRTVRSGGTHEYDFAGLTAVVTGGASGIGAAAATILADRGAEVAVLDLNPNGAKNGFRCDVSDDGEVRAAIEAVAAQFGGIDVLVNNAGIGAAG